MKVLKGSYINFIDLHNIAASAKPDKYQSKEERRSFYKDLIKPLEKLIDESPLTKEGIALEQGRQAWIAKHKDAALDAEALKAVLMATPEHKEFSKKLTDMLDKKKKEELSIEFENTSHTVFTRLLEEKETQEMFTNTSVLCEFELFWEKVTDKQK